MRCKWQEKEKYFPHLQRSRGDLTRLIEIEAEELRKTRRVRIHMRSTISKGLENCEERVQFLDSQDL